MDLIETLAANLNANVRTCPTCDDIVVGESPYGLCRRCLEGEDLMLQLEELAYYAGGVARVCHICNVPSVVARPQAPCDRCAGKGCK